MQGFGLEVGDSWTSFVGFSFCLTLHLVSIPARPGVDVTSALVEGERGRLHREGKEEPVEFGRWLFKGL